MPVYKVIEKKQSSWWHGKITAQALEDLINETSRAGWVLEKIEKAETSRFMGLLNKSVFLLIFRKLNPAPPPQQRRVK